LDTKLNGEKKDREKQLAAWTNLLQEVIEVSTAGLPQDATIKWTYLTQAQIQALFLEKGVQISLYYIRILLAREGYKKRKMLKMDTIKDVENRNEQFEKIATYRNTCGAAGIPILSIDTKNKELLGDFAREGKAYATDKRTRRDHDFQAVTDTKMVPHGIYDVLDNKGYITLGSSKDTAEFVCDNIESYWKSDLQYKYPNADTILLLCDGGGSNAASHYIVKQELLRLANALQMKILVAHYPPYCSKWNPIEHRLFSQISHTWDGISLTDLPFVQRITNTTTTKTGLRVVTNINEKGYATGKTVSQHFKENINDYVLFDDKLAKWNYLISPTSWTT
jgi:Rhodopirellula transposase DDE domain